MADEYTPGTAADDALCTAADDRAAQYAVPDATDDDLALADSVFVNRVHQAILGSTWLEERLEERLEQARDEEREHIARSIEAEAPSPGSAYANAGVAYERGGMLRAARIVREGA